VFSIFATLGIIEFKVFGVGMAAAVLIDATVVRGVLLPAGLALLGDRAWSLRARPAYGATASLTCSEPPRATNGWSRSKATAPSMSSARSSE
jgi:putative drug exporter of the RND superfamily